MATKRSSKSGNDLQANGRPHSIQQRRGLKPTIPWEVRGPTVSQSDLPEIFGLNWRPEAPLEFFQPLPKDAARSEVLTFLAQQHDAHLFLVANIWDHIIGAEPETFEGASWHAFSERFLVEEEQPSKRAPTMTGEIQIVCFRILLDWYGFARVTMLPQVPDVA